MHTLNNYCLVRRMEKKKGLYERMHNWCLVLDILGVVSILPCIWMIWLVFVPILFFVLSFVLSYLSGKVLYTLSYRFSDGVLFVIKTDLGGVETVMEKIEAKKMISCTFEKPPKGAKCYYASFDDFGGDQPLHIVGENQNFYVLSDKYLYSIIAYERR